MKTIEANGVQHQFPDEATDAEISAALSGPPENAITRGYREAVEPLTRITKAALGNMPNALGFLSQVAQRGYAGEGAQRADEAIRQAGAEQVVPQTPTDLAITLGTGGAGRLAPAVTGATKLARAGQAALGAGERIGGAMTGQAAGNVLEGRPVEEGLGRTGGIAATMEALGPILGRVGRWLPGAKGRINEQQAEHLVQAGSQVSPEFGQAVQAARSTVKPGTAGQTQAAVQEAVLGGGAQQAMSDRMERMVQNIERVAPGLAMDTPALQRGYSTLPALEQERIGLPGPKGFSLRQAQQIRSYVGSNAFAESTHGQGVTPVAKQDLWKRISDDMEAAIGRATTTTPGMLTGWRVANRDYAGGQALVEGLNPKNAFPGAPNEIRYNRNQLSDYLSQNREELRQKLGPQQYEALVNAVLEGGQVGTKDILAPGGGGALDALRQVWGRGQGGAPQIAGSLLRFPFPNIGSQYTGFRRPGLSSGGQALTDIGALRAAGILPQQPPAPP